VVTRFDASGILTVGQFWREFAPKVLVSIPLSPRFTRNNGITEGFHRKMKLIQRRAYGFLVVTSSSGANSSEI
jgi:hypothetical protein